jgi:DNA-binding MarR family transcriptional regulator
MRSKPSGNSLGDALHHLVHSYKSSLREAIRAQAIALPITHIRVLKGVCRNPECTAQSIGNRMQRDKAQITRVLKELLDEGLIIKVDNPADRRSQLLRPTAQGEAVMAQLSELENQTIARMTQNLTDDEVASFMRIAKVMAGNLKGDESLATSGDN